jgi:hypothetical protein
MRSNSKARIGALIVGVVMMTEAIPAHSSKPESSVQTHICVFHADMGTLYAHSLRAILPVRSGSKAGTSRSSNCIKR